MIRTWLDHCLPFDAHKLCTDRVTIAIRQVPSTRCYDSTSLKLSSAPMAGNGVTFAVPDEGSPYRRLFGQRSRYRTVFFLTSCCRLMCFRQSMLLRSALFAGW